MLNALVARSGVQPGMFLCVEVVRVKEFPIEDRDDMEFAVYVGSAGE